jgi:hypothetical protein
LRIGNGLGTQVLVSGVVSEQFGDVVTMRSDTSASIQ